METEQISRLVSPLCPSSCDSLFSRPSEVRTPDARGSVFQTFISHVNALVKMNVEPVRHPDLPQQSRHGRSSFSTRTDYNTSRKNFLLLQARRVI